jgi:hypothetical protein
VSNPALLTVPDGQMGRTTVTWSAPSVDATVLMSVDGGRPQAVAHGSSGSQIFEVSQGTTTFSVAWGADSSEQLATAAVAAVSPDPPLCGMAPAGPALHLEAGFTLRDRRRLAEATRTRYGETVRVKGTLSLPGGAKAGNERVCIVAQADVAGASKKVYGGVVTDRSGSFSYLVLAGTSRTLWFISDTARGPVSTQAHLVVQAPSRSVPHAHGSSTINAWFSSDASPARSHGPESWSCCRCAEATDGRLSRPP